MPVTHNLQDAIADRPRYAMLQEIFGRAAKPHLIENQSKDPDLAAMNEGKTEVIETVADYLSRECSSVFMGGWMRGLRLENAEKGEVTQASLRPEASSFIPYLEQFGLTEPQIDAILDTVLTDLSRQGEKVTLPLKIEVDRKTIQSALKR